MTTERSSPRRLAVTALLLTWASIAHPAPAVVISIKPIHALASAIMAGAGEPELLIEAMASPHHYSLNPSDARALSEAELIIWIGPELETFLSKAIASLSKHATSVTLLDQKEITVYPQRGAADGHEQGTRGRDPHIWLDPINAIAIARVISRALIAIDPDQAQLYTKNLENTEQGLRELDAEIEKLIRPIKNNSYVVAHDAFQYFEKRYDLDKVIHLNYVPSVLPGAKRLSEVRSEIARRGARCVFFEPQLGTGWLPVLSEGREIHSGVLDPLGVAVPVDRNGYEMLLMNIATALANCLSAKQ